MIKPDNNPSGNFKNYYAYCKMIGNIQGKPAIAIYLYRKFWKHAMWRVKLDLFKIWLYQTLFNTDITKPQ